MNDKYIRRGSQVAARMLDGEMIVMSIGDSTVFTLNETAALLWNAADGVTPLRELVSREIVEHFEIDTDSAYRDALSLVEDLAQHGILRVADHPLEGEVA